MDTLVTVKQLDLVKKFNGNVNRAEKMTSQQCNRYLFKLKAELLGTVITVGSYEMKHTDNWKRARMNIKSNKRTRR